MESPLTITRKILIVLIFLIIDASRSTADDFLECLINRFELSNSAADIIYTPQNSSYASLLLSSNLRPSSTSPVKPHLILTPFYVSEIQAAVYCSRILGMQIRVRSGGHDYEGLSYTSEIPFVVVDMRNIRSVHVDVGKKTAWVQSGATLGELYHTIARNSRTLGFPAGVCPTVGVGGHLSGGGYGMMSRKHSIAADHIIDARLINAKGEIQDRRTMGEDLFWAIRGGGGTSFGIIVEFKVKLVTVPELVTVFNVTRMSEAAIQLTHRWQYIAAKMDEDLLIRLFLHSATSPTTGNRTASASFTTLYLGRARDLTPLMQEQFPELGLVEQDCKEMSWVESAVFFAGLSNQPVDILLDKMQLGGPIYGKGKSDYATTPIPIDGLRGIWRFLHKEDEYVAEVQFSPYGGILKTISESETPFPHRADNIFCIHYGVTWASPLDSGKHIGWIRRFYSYMAPYVSQSPRMAYFNYRDLDIGRNSKMERNTSYEEASVWGFKYFKNNFERLVRVKTKVDPSNFFRNEQSIPPLVPSPEGRASWK